MDQTNEIVFNHVPLSYRFQQIPEFDSINKKRRQKDGSICNSTTTHFDDIVLFADSSSCIAGVRRRQNNNTRRENCETKVRVGGCTSSRMIIRALLRVLGKIHLFQISNN